MVRRRTMSTINGGGEGDVADSQPKEKDLLYSIRNIKMLIDLVASHLETSRLQIPTDSDCPPNTLEENIIHLESKLLRHFSHQLKCKHDYLRHPRSEVNADMMRQVDSLISLETFLNIFGLPELVKAISISNEEITLDMLFGMTQRDMHQLWDRLEVSDEDRLKLANLMSGLSYFYDIWDRGEKPKAEPYDPQRYSSSGRLSSIASIASLESRKYSSSSNYLNAVSPTTAVTQHSRSSTPVTPLTPSSVHSVPTSHGLTYQHSSPSILTNSVESSPPFTKKSSSTNSSSGYFGSGYFSIDHHHNSSSSSSINSDVSASQTQVPPPKLEEPPKPRRRVGHTRSHSNPPLANLVLMPESVPENEVASEYRSPSPPYYGSTTLTTRTGSQPSIMQHGVLNSPSTKTHPQMRRLMASAPYFSRSISQELNGSDGRQYMPMDGPQRSNSESSGVQSATPHQRRLSRESATSSSMVDLPFVRASNENLHNDYRLPQSGKSYSVPKLAHLAVNGDNSVERAQFSHSTSVPTSPRVPNEYTPTGVMGHAIHHRFVSKTFLKPRYCDYCKKTLAVHGYKCKDCRYKCHKQCSKLAPHSCGLSQDLLKYFKNHLLVNAPAPSLENMRKMQMDLYQKQQQQQRGKASSHHGNMQNSSQIYPQTPPLQQRVEEEDEEEDEDEEENFVIPMLNREPFNSQYSPIINRRHHSQSDSPIQEHENTLTASHPFMQHSYSARLEVPLHYHPSPLHKHHHQRPHNSTSSSPSTSTHSSPCLTPVSPHSPTAMEYPPSSYTSGYMSSTCVPVIYTDVDDSTDDDQYVAARCVNGRNWSEEDSQEFSSCSSQGSSNNDISDTDRLSSSIPRGLRPPPQVVSAQSLPNLLFPEDQPSSSPPGMFSSEDNLKYRRDSLVNTVSTADSKASTLVDSTMAEDDTDDDDETDPEYYSSQGNDDGFEKPTFRQFRMNRHSVVDEWLIPYTDIKLVEQLSKGQVTQVYRGNWHGEVAVKRYHMPNATNEQITQFREEVSILKKTRHDNLALFMGASLTPPNFAIVTSYCKGSTIYKRLHQWSEHFPIDKAVNISRQIAQAMGYLHARGIIHKNLTTRNVFLEKTLEKDKAVLTDMGLSSFSTRQSSRSVKYLAIDHNKLSYLAPESMRELSSKNGHKYTEQTDIFAFGTILYEMITRKFPFATHRLGFAYEPHVIIYLVGTGTKPEIKSQEAPLKLKNLVLSCWHENPMDRPPFSDLCENLARFLRRHTPITRSPSYPTNLSKSVDNLLFI